MTTQIADQRILVLDIETSPSQAFVWRAYGEQNISTDQLIKAGSVICVGAKWVGDKETFLYSDWEHGHQGMLEAVHEMMSYADAIVSYNGQRFDVPKLQGEFLLAGLGPTPPVTQLDCLKAVRKLGFFQNKLAYIGPLIVKDAKMKHEGFSLWVKVMEGHAGAQKRMGKYCKQDVRLTEKLYLRIRPFFTNHPHMGRTGANACGACGSVEVQSRGTRRTRTYKIQRLHCQTCGSWQDGKRTKV